MKKSFWHNALSISNQNIINVIYVDDTFTVFENIEQSENFLKFINTFHPNLKFTIDHESNNRLPFLDVLVDNSKQDLSFSVYRKKTFTGLSINFFSFCPLNFKINAFKTLLHRSYNICSNYHILHNEIENLQKLFTNNGFPLKLLQNLTKKFLNNKISPVKPVITVPKKIIYLSIPYIGPKSETLKKNFHKYLSTNYPAINFRIILSNNFSIGSLFNFKDKVDPLLCSNVIYDFKCPNCNMGHYIGSTSRSLYVRSHEHRGTSYRTKRQIVSPFSSIRQHTEDKHGLLPNLKDFSIKRKVKDPSVLLIVESIFIKNCKPDLNNTICSHPLYIA